MSFETKDQLDETKTLDSVDDAEIEQEAPEAQEVVETDDAEVMTEEKENSQPVNKFCANCGNRVMEDIKFCPACGKNLHEIIDESVAPVTIVSEENTTKYQKNIFEKLGFTFGMIGLFIGWLIPLFPIAGLGLSILGLIFNKNENKSKSGLVLSILGLSFFTLFYTIIELIG